MTIDWDLLLEIHKDMPRQGSGRDKYTQKAFEMIPVIKQPKILDIGCGPGMQTIKLAKLSDGKIIGIDIFQQYLDQLQQFEKGLLEWKKYIKPNGYLAVHEMTWLKEKPPKEISDYWEQVYPDITTIEEKLTTIEKCGYNVLGYFPLPEDAWWEFYYDPLQSRLEVLKVKYNDNPKALEMINEEQLEIDLFRKYNSWYGSVFYVMQEQSH